jgi:hypothetical protein
MMPDTQKKLLGHWVERQTRDTPASTLVDVSWHRIINGASTALRILTADT